MPRPKSNDITKFFVFNGKKSICQCPKPKAKSNSPANSSVIVDLVDVDDLNENEDDAFDANDICGYEMEVKFQ